MHLLQTHPSALKSGWGTIRAPALQHASLPMLRHRFRKGFQAWLILALALASLLVGRPLHEALHLSAPPFVAALQGLADTADSAPDDAPAEPAHQTGACVWCLLHADALHTGSPLAGEQPPAKPAATPPEGLSTSAPKPAEIRAAPPRGPPLA